MDAQPPLPDLFDLTDRTAVVTGGTRGIGRAITRGFADLGADVVPTSRSRDDVEAAAADVRDRGGATLVQPTDVTDADAVDDLFRRTVDEFGGVDVLVNNAGGVGGDEFDEVTPEAWRDVLDVNLTGVYHCTQAFGDHLKESGGAVVNVGSMAGEYGVPGMTPYSAAKAGVSTFTRALAAEWADEDVRLNAVAPGFVATEQVREKMGIDREVDRSEADRNVGTPGEVADLVRYLASPASSFVDGETVEITGKPHTYGPGDVAE